jgi:hypothetical protein
MGAWQGVVLLATQIHVTESTCRADGTAQFSDKTFGEVRCPLTPPRGSSQKTLPPLKVGWWVEHR